MPQGSLEHLAAVVAKFCLRADATAKVHDAFLERLAHLGAGHHGMVGSTIWRAHYARGEIKLLGWEGLRGLWSTELFGRSCCDDRVKVPNYKRNASTLAGVEG